MCNESVLTAAYLINRTPSSILSGLSPYQKLFGSKPTLSHLRNFGCLVFCSNLNPKDKFDARAKKCVFLGYSIHKKGYKLFDLDNKSVLHSRDVKFYESVYPFKIEKFLETEKINFNDIYNFFLENDNIHFSQTDKNRQHKPNDDDMASESNPIDSDIPGSSDHVLHQSDEILTENNHTTSAQKATSHIDNDEYSHDFTPELDTVFEEIRHDQTNEDINKDSAPEGTHSKTLRKSSRSSMPPKRFNDFIIEGKVKYGIEKVVNYSKLSSETYSFLTALDKFVVPRNYKEASNDPNWILAMNNEMEPLSRNNTRVLSDLPHGRKPVGCKWLYKFKYKPDGQVERYRLG